MQTLTHARACSECSYASLLGSYVTQLGHLHPRGACSSVSPRPPCARVHMQDYLTPLHLAAVYNHTDAMALLIDRKARVEARDKVKPDRVEHRHVQEEVCVGVGVYMCACI